MAGPSEWGRTLVQPPPSQALVTPALPHQNQPSPIPFPGLGKRRANAKVGGSAIALLVTSNPPRLITVLITARGPFFPL